MNSSKGDNKKNNRRSWFGRKKNDPKSPGDTSTKPGQLDIPVLDLSGNNQPSDSQTKPTQKPGRNRSGSLANSQSKNRGSGIFGSSLFKKTPRATSNDQTRTNSRSTQDKSLQFKLFKLHSEYNNIKNLASQLELEIAALSATINNLSSPEMAIVKASLEKTVKVMNETLISLNEQKATLEKVFATQEKIKELTNTKLDASTANPRKVKELESKRNLLIESYEVLKQIHMVNQQLAEIKDPIQMSGLMAKKMILSSIASTIDKLLEARTHLQTQRDKDANIDMAAKAGINAAKRIISGDVSQIISEFKDNLQKEKLLPEALVILRKQLIISEAMIEGGLPDFSKPTTDDISSTKELEKRRLFAVNQLYKAQYDLIKYQLENDKPFESYKPSGSLEVRAETDSEFKERIAKGIAAKETKIKAHGLKVIDATKLLRTRERITTVELELETCSDSDKKLLIQAKLDALKALCLAQQKVCNYIPPKPGITVASLKADLDLKEGEMVAATEAYTSSISEDNQVLQKLFETMIDSQLKVYTAREKLYKFQASQEVDEKTLRAKVRECKKAAVQADKEVKSYRKKTKAPKLGGSKLTKASSTISLGQRNYSLGLGGFDNLETPIRTHLGPKMNNSGVTGDDIAAVDILISASAKLHEKSSKFRSKESFEALLRFLTTCQIPERDKFIIHCIEFFGLDPFDLKEFGEETLIQLIFSNTTSLEDAKSAERLVKYFLHNYSSYQVEVTSFKSTTTELKSAILRPDMYGTNLYSSLDRKISDLNTTLGFNEKSNPARAAKLQQAIEVFKDLKKYVEKFFAPKTPEEFVEQSTPPGTGRGIVITPLGAATNSTGQKGCLPPLSSVNPAALAAKLSKTSLDSGSKTPHDLPAGLHDSTPSPVKPKSLSRATTFVFEKPGDAGERTATPSPTQEQIDNMGDQQKKYGTVKKKWLARVSSGELSKGGAKLKHQKSGSKSNPELGSDRKL